jgi:hypothetical protein
LSGKDLRRDSIVIFNSILSARLICVLDFIFAEITLTESATWLADCWPISRPCSDLPSRSRILALSQTFVATRQEKSKIAGVR